MQCSDWIAVASTFLGLGVGSYAIHCSNKTSSAAILVGLGEAFRQAWQRFLQDKTDYEFTELLNLFEVIAAIYLDGSLSGIYKPLLGEYVHETYKLLVEDPENEKRMQSLMETPTTYAYIRRFLERRSSEERAITSLTRPKKIYPTV